MDQFATGDEEDPMPAFGMWQDREDVADIEVYVREVCKERPLVG